MAKIRVLETYEVAECTSEDEAKDAILNRFPNKEIMNVLPRNSAFIVTTQTEVTQE